MDCEDRVFLGNHNKTSKYNQLFVTEPFGVIGWKKSSNKVAVRRNQSILFCHPDGLKLYKGSSKIMQNDKVENIIEGIVEEQETSQDEVFSLESGLIK